MTSEHLPRIVLLSGIALIAAAGGFLACKKKKDNPATSTTASGTVTLTSSACGASPAGTVTITGASSDAPDLAAIEFLLDGNSLVTDGSSPYQVAWDTTGDASGVHNITARVVNSAGLKGAASSPCAVTLAKRVFTTNSHATFSGISGGDTFCQTTADAVALSGTWKAWLSNSSTSAKDRFTDVGPWYRPDKTTLVFANKAALTGNPAVPLQKNESGADLAPVSHPVWTGTQTGGVSAANHCEDWATIAGTANGMIGDSAQNNANWSSQVGLACDQTAHLYCFEQ